MLGLDNNSFEMVKKRRDQLKEMRSQKEASPNDKPPKPVYEGHSGPGSPLRHKQNSGSNRRARISGSPAGEYNSQGPSQMYTFNQATGTNEPSHSLRHKSKQSRSRSSSKKRQPNPSSGLQTSQSQMLNSLNFQSHPAYGGGSLL